MPRVACVMMQKDELGLLEAWLVYHGYAFGLENLYVFDNGSTNPKVLSTLEEFKSLGVKVNLTNDKPDDYKNKHKILGCLIRQLKGERLYDFVIPLDCDEFVVKKTNAGLTCDKDVINGYLSTLIGETRVLRTPYQLANHPLAPDFYSFYEFRKIFFSSGPVQEADHGFHHIAGKSGAEYFDTKIVHLHFHNRPFEELIRVSKVKWGGRLDLDDKEALRRYKGPSMHLVEHFLSDEATYYGKFRKMVQFYFPSFRKHLFDLGSSIKWSADCAVEAPHKTPDKPFFPWGYCSDKGEDNVTNVFVPTQLNEAEYLSAHADIRERQIDPTLHYSRYGFKEWQRFPRPADS